MSDAENPPAETTPFVIEKPGFESSTGTARFSYKLAGQRFVETLHFPGNFDTEVTRSADFLQLLNICACVLGVSYFKLIAPTRIELPGFALNAQQRAFVTDIYENGLGEFYARNKLYRFGKISVPPRTATPNDTPNAPLALAEKTSALILIGGGKDSLVSVQLAQKMGQEFTPFAVNPKGPIVSSIAVLRKTPLYVRRNLDPEMIRLGTQPGFYNGHVPSTAINSIIAALAALLFGFNAIILSNERSASEGNLVHDGRQINHQHSKSLAFERQMRKMLERTTGGQLDYFSLLRPYSELRIAGMFAQDTRFDEAFSSCNRNFTLKQHTGSRWCGACPKCHFVFLILAPFMPPERLKTIFGINFLAREEHLVSFRQLSGLDGHKPWECVGEILEAAACIYNLSHNSDWAKFAVISTLGREVEAFYGAQILQNAWKEMMQDSPAHHIPAHLAPPLDVAHQL